MRVVVDRLDVVDFIQQAGIGSELVIVLAPPAEVKSAVTAAQRSTIFIGTPAGGLLLNRP